MQRMKTLGIVLALSLLVVPITPAFAKTSPSNIHYGCLGMTTGSLMGTPFMIEAINVEKSPYGPYDFMAMLIGMDMYCYTDNADIVPVFEGLMEGMGMFTIDVVDDEVLEIWKKGKKMFLEFDYMNLYVEFKGISGAMKGTESMTNPNGWAMDVTFVGFYAFVSAPIMEYIGVGEFATQMRMTITYTPPL